VAFRLKTAADFIKAGASAWVWAPILVDVKALRAGEANVITERARQYVQLSGKRDRAPANK